MKKLKTNSNEVRKAVQEHILKYYTIEELKNQLDYMSGGHYQHTIYRSAYSMVQGGCFLIYYEDIKDFLNSLGINPENKEYADEKSWELYKHLVAINAERLYNGKGVK